jgi:hypothetical protein
MEGKCNMSFNLILAFILAVQLPPSEQKVKDSVDKIGIGGRITVVLINGEERYGSVTDVGSTSFEIVEVDLRQKVTIDYTDVKKVRRNYGGKNSISGKRPNPMWGLIAGVAIFGTLFIVLAVGLRND